MNSPKDSLSELTFPYQLPNAKIIPPITRTAGGVTNLAKFNAVASHRAQLLDERSRLDTQLSGRRLDKSSVPP